MGLQLASQVSSGNRTGAGIRGEQVRPGSAATQRVAAGSVLFSEGDSADAVFEVVSGTLRLHKILADGRRQIVGFVSGGRLLGVAQQGEYICTAEALTAVVLRRQPRLAFERRIEEEPGLARTLLTEMCNELRMAQDQMLLLGRKSAVEKVASFLLALATDKDGALADRVELPMSRADIADYLGLTTETVSRTFTRLKGEGLISLPCAVSVRFEDPERLEDLASGGRDEEPWPVRGGRW